MEYQLWLAPWHSFNFGTGLGASSINQWIFIYILYQYKLKNRLVHITVFFRGGHVICCALRRWCPRQSCLGSNWPLCHNWIFLHGNNLMSSDDRFPIGAPLYNNLFERFSYTPWRSSPQWSEMLVLAPLQSGPGLAGSSLRILVQLFFSLVYVLWCSLVWRLPSVFFLLNHLSRPRAGENFPRCSSLYFWSNLLDRWFKIKVAYWLLLSLSLPTSLSFSLTITIQPPALCSSCRKRRGWARHPPWRRERGSAGRRTWRWWWEEQEQWCWCFREGGGLNLCSKKNRQVHPGAGEQPNKVSMTTLSTNDSAF